MTGLTETAIISVVGIGVSAIIAYFSHKTAKQKNRLDAYDKRKAIFTSTQDFLTRAARSNDYSDGATLLGDFDTSIQDASFLFDEKLANYLGTLSKGAKRHFILQTKLEIQGGSLELREKRALENEIRRSHHWLVQQHKHINKRFAKFLSLKGA